MAADTASGAAGVQIICPGLMCTDHNCLEAALRVLGYENTHESAHILESQELWTAAIQNRTTKEDFQRMLQGVHVLIGLPTFVFWEQVLEAFPNAKVILTTRDEAEWFRSVRKAKEHMDTAVPAAPFCSGYFLRTVERWMLPSYSKLCDVLRFSWAAALGLSFLDDYALNEHTTRGMFRKHNNYVQQRVPEGQLLVMDVREGWGRLCAFLGRERPAESFPGPFDAPHLALDEGQRPQGLVGKSVGLPERGETSVLEQLMTKELRRGVSTVSAAALLLACMTFTLLLRGAPVACVVASASLVAYLSLGIWAAVRYIVWRLPVGPCFPVAPQGFTEGEATGPGTRTQWPSAGPRPTTRSHRSLVTARSKKSSPKWPRLGASHSEVSTSATSGSSDEQAPDSSTDDAGSSDGEKTRPGPLGGRD